MFKNISNYNDIDSYLPMFLSALIIYIGGIVYISYFEKEKKEKLAKFYDSFNIGVIFTDLLLFVISMCRTRLLYPYIFTNYTLSSFLFVGALSQIVYDVFLVDFYNLIPTNSSLYFSLLNQHNKILKIPVMITNIITNVIGLLIASHLASHTVITNVNLLITGLSLIPYLIYFIK